MLLGPLTPKLAVQRDFQVNASYHKSKDTLGNHLRAVEELKQLNENVEKKPFFRTK